MDFEANNLFRPTPILFPFTQRICENVERNEKWVFLLPIAFSNCCHPWYIPFNIQPILTACIFVTLVDDWWQSHQISYKIIRSSECDSRRDTKTKTFIAILHWIWMCAGRNAHCAPVTRKDNVRNLCANRITQSIIIAESQSRWAEKMHDFKFA